MFVSDTKGNYAVKERKQRVAQVIRTLEVARDNKVEISHKKFKAELTLKFGLSARKVQEYIKDLYEAEVIEIYDNDAGDECIRLR